ncbi:MAG TPA: hypothetical protein VIX84_22655 [Acidimicrobiales bacterium]
MGDTSLGDINGVPFSEQWNGTSWTLIAPMPAASGAGVTGSSLSSVSCAGPSFCQAVGQIVAPAERNFIETWNGTKWSIDPSVPNPSTTRQGLAGVDCFSATSCTAVGTAETPTIADSTLVLVWNGTS